MMIKTFWQFCLAGLLICGFSATAWGESKLLAVQHWQHGDLGVYFVPVHDWPMVNVTVLLSAGAAYDTKPGVAALTAKTLKAGTKQLAAAELTNALASQGVTFDARVDLTHAHVAMQSTRAAWPTVLRMLPTILGEPSFPVEGIARAQQRLGHVWALQHQDPAYLANLAFRQQLFTGPLAHAVLGDAKSDLMALHRADLVQFYRKHYGASGASLLVVGDVKRQAVDRLAAALLRALPGTTRTTLAKSQRQLPTQQRVHVSYPSTQTHLLVGQPTVSASHPDYWPLKVGNWLLGGGTLSSELFKVIRKQEGLAYSVRSGISGWMPGVSVWRMSLQTRNEQARRARQLLLQTARRFIDQGPPAESVRLAKTHLIGALPLGFDSNVSLMQRLVTMVQLALPLDYYDRYADHIRSVTPQAVRDAMRQHWRPGQWLVLTLGPAKSA